MINQVASDKPFKIATIGDHRVFAAMTLGRAGDRFELVSTLHFKNATCELARELADDEDEAIAIATDLEYAAQDELKVLDIDYSKDPRGWPEALQEHFDRARYLIAAE